MSFNGSPPLRQNVKNGEISEIQFDRLQNLKQLRKENSALSFMRKVDGSLKYPQTNHSDFISNFGKFSNIDLEDQRTILFSKGGKDNKGEFLSIEEKQSLADCLKINQMSILSAEEINDLVIDTYGSNARECK